jgi:hypothetical protein
MYQAILVIIDIYASWQKLQKHPVFLKQLRNTVILVLSIAALNLVDKYY